MSETLPIEQPEEPEIVSDHDCAGCGGPAMAGDHPTPLCRDCREKFIKYPIPLWIRVFAACLGALVLFSLFTLPKDLSVGIHLEKGKKAERQKKYFTAQREMEKVLESTPKNVEAEGHLMVDAYYNQDIATLAKEYKDLQNVNIEDADLLASMQYVLDKSENYFATDTFKNWTSSYAEGFRIPDTAWAGFLARYPHDVNALMSYASVLFDQDNYTRCDSCLKGVLAADPVFYPALSMMASCKRGELRPDEAIPYNDQMLGLNAELPYNIASKARTLLMQKNDKLGLELALKSYKADPNSVFAQGTLIMAYHFNDRPKDRDDLIKIARNTAKDSTEKVSLKYALDVIAKKEKFRD